jgi:hypothetical protein
MLTLTHHINSFIGAYWYTLEGEILDSEGNSVIVGEGTPKLAKISKTVKFYKDNGFLFVNVKHAVKQD